MFAEINNADFKTLQTWWHTPPPQLVNETGEELILDEIAYALSEKGAAGIEFLMRYTHSKDIARRATAIYFLAHKDNATPQTEAILQDAFNSGILRLQMTALQGFIHAGLFPLKREGITSLDGSTDGRLPAWGMTYLCHAFPEDRSVILSAALQNENPHLRSFACDVIGDAFLQDMKSEMEPLLQDEDSVVAESANYNYHEMLD